MHAFPQPTLYAEVNTTLAAFTDHVQITLGTQLVGIYLSGSLALGGFDLETSDIDLVVVTDGALATDQLEALAEMHKRFAAGASRWARKLEVIYAPREALAGELPGATRYPQVETELGFVLQPLEDGWLAQCATVREHGVTLFGPEPKTLFQAVDVRALRQSVARIPEMWRNDAQNDRSWLEWLRVRRNQSFVVLTLCRLLYTLETGAVASKPAAAR